MNKNFMLGKESLVKRLAISSMILFSSTSIFAQNAKQIETIRKNTNSFELHKFSSEYNRRMLSTPMLKVEAKQQGIPFSGEVKDRYYQLYDIDKTTGRPIYIATYNAGAAAGTQTNKLYTEFGDYDLDGEGMTAYEWDGGGVRTSHVEFGGRVTQKDTPETLSSHSTHVAGTLIAAGVDANAKGMSYKAKLNAYEWNGDVVEMSEAAKDGALVSNHSYGFLGGFEWTNQSGQVGWHWFGGEDDTEYYGYGQYGETDRSWDNVVYNAPYYLPVKAAGNPRGDGPRPGESHYVSYVDGSGRRAWKLSNKVRQKNGGEDGFDCIVTGSVAKNILSVGAAEKLHNNEYTQPSDVKMASFSAYGPIDDGRIKPDITGIGVNLYSANSKADNSYTTMSGTSMASPNVTGSLLLLQELYSKKNNGAFMKASTLKALVLGTANEAGNAPGPDYSSGWGLLNSYAAANTIALNGVYSLIQSNQLENGKTFVEDVIALGTEPLKVTIAWTDPVPAILPDPETLNDPTKMLVNDLDIVVTENGNEYHAWVLDPTNPAAPATTGDNTVDNVEQVYIPNPTEGATYTITVSHKGRLKRSILQDKLYRLLDASSQDFSMVVTGINMGEITKDLSLKSLKIDVPKDQYSKATPVKIEVSNVGTETASGAKVKYKFINEDENRVIDDGEISLGDLLSGESVEKQIYVDLSKSFVKYRIEAEVEFSEDRINTNNHLYVKIFGVIADLTKEGDEYRFGFEEDLESYGWKTEDLDGNGETWKKFDNRSYSYAGNSLAMNYPDSDYGTNDWLFTNPIRFRPNTPYRVTFYIKKFNELPEGIQVGIGKQAKANSMTYISDMEVEAATNGEYKKCSFEFSISGSKEEINYLGFQHKAEGKTYALALDNVRIYFAEGKPDVDFLATNRRPTTYEVVTLENNTLTASTLPINQYKWKIVPNSFRYVEGTNSSSKSPKVIFEKERAYTISLKATNARGQNLELKEHYVKVSNEETVASFEVDNTDIYDQDVIKFRNTSKGKPSPDSFEWRIIPVDGVKYIDGTDPLSKDPVVKFIKPGVYSVFLTAKSVHNKSVEKKREYITVKNVFNPVRNLDYTVNHNSKSLKLFWDRPILVPLYEEKFGSLEIPQDMTVIDNNNDGITWKISRSNKAVESESWEYPHSIEKDDWLITGKVAKNAEILKYSAKHPRYERYEVYLVPANGDTPPTVQEILNKGKELYSFKATGKQEELAEKVIDINQYTNTDFYIAFHHSTKFTDDALYLMIDDIYIGYDNSVNNSKMDKNNYSRNTVNISNTENKPFGANVKPSLASYIVYKDGIKVAELDGMNNLVYAEQNLVKGVYDYDVYAVYSDGTSSDKETIRIDLRNLSLDDITIAEDELRVYPNPSQGLFNVRLPKTIDKVQTIVYDLSGKVVYKKEVSRHNNQLDLTGYAKGVYLLKVVDGSSNVSTTKLIIK